eukprot:8157626-Karenia_brevis.AAC.1
MLFWVVDAVRIACFPTMITMPLVDLRAIGQLHQLASAYPSRKERGSCLGYFRISRRCPMRYRTIRLRHSSA